MTDEEIIDHITRMVAPPGNTSELDPIWRFITDNREPAGWKRRFTDSEEWCRRNASVLAELKKPKFGRKP